MNVFVPSADFCYGRGEIAENIIIHSLSDGVTFLFGGRQSGKTTILLRTQKILTSRYDPSALDVIVPVYINLLRLPHNPTPENFFQLAFNETVESCKYLFHNITFELPFSDTYSRDSLKTFEDNITLLLNFLGEKQVHFFYLFDEPNKIFRENFSSGFNDNLFYAFYISEKISGNISAIFSGSQELYELIEDKGTSPLGSRANLEYLTNLSKNVIDEMVSSNLIFPNVEERKQFINELFNYSGGHAGICAYIIKWHLKQNAELELESLIQNFLDRHSQLFNIWLRSLSPEAIALHHDLVENVSLDIKTVPKILRENNLNSIYSDWAIKQILFTGIGYSENEKIKPNNMYVNYIKQSSKLDNTVDEEDTFEIEELLEKPLPEFTPADCSRLLDRLENGLRRLIANRLSMISTKWWKQRIPNDIRVRAEERKLEREKDYPGMSQQNRPLYDYLDFPDLHQIITMKLNWNDAFKDIFKRQEMVTVKLGEINPFRNDIAHNRDLPSSDKELFISNSRQFLRTIKHSKTTKHPLHSEPEGNSEVSNS